MVKNYSGNQDTNDVETESYDDVSKPYAELNRSTGNETKDDKTYQKLLKNYSSNQNTDGVETGSNVDDSKQYAELNRSTGNDTTDDKTYQKLLKDDLDYVIPADAHGESSDEEIGLTNVAYTELDDTKREEASYQKLLKE